MNPRQNPLDDVQHLFDRVTRQLEEGRWNLAGSMAVDLADEGDEFVVTVDVPGYEKDDIDVWVTDQTLRIEAQRTAEAGESDRTYVRHERTHRTASRSVELPDAVDRDGVSATLRNGVLTVTVPKLQPAADATQIEIED